MSGPAISDEMVRQVAEMMASALGLPAGVAPTTAETKDFLAALVASGWRREADVLREAADHFAAHWYDRGQAVLIARELRNHAGRATALEPVGAHAQGYAEAVARLRDDARYRDWWTSGGVKPDAPIRRHLADYLETVGPDGPDVTTGRWPAREHAVVRAAIAWRKAVDDLDADEAVTENALIEAVDALKGTPVAGSFGAVVREQSGLKGTSKDGQERSEEKEHG